jgi:hypothetical protein
MKEEEFRRIAVLAIKEEARRKPGERLFIGSRGFTFTEVAEGVEKGDPFITENFLKPFLKMLKSSEAFRRQVLSLVGEK